MTVRSEHGGTIALGTQAGTYRFNSIAGHEEEGDKIESTHLGTTGKRTFEPGDLINCGEFDVEIQFDNKIGNPNTYVKETITITWPLASGETTAGNVAGEGFIRKIKYPDHKAGSTDLRRAVWTVVWTGVTGPTVTKATGT